MSAGYSVEAATFVCAALTLPLTIQPATATDFTAQVVMEKMKAEERLPYLAGVVEGLAYARYARDNKDVPADKKTTLGMKCIYDWFYVDNQKTLNTIYARSAASEITRRARSSRRFRRRHAENEMLIAQEVALMEIFRVQAAERKRELRFYEDSERTLERQTAYQRHEEEQRRDLERLEAATADQIGVFRDRLDHYDTAVVEALMENGEALDKARQRREDIEAKAYRLPDGRMAFKTGDGKRVMDENGKEVPRGVIQPESIPNDAPQWDAFKAATSEEKRLLKERDELHDYQQKLDQARDNLDKGGVTSKDLDTLGDDLEKSMPDAVKQKVGEQGPSREPDAQQVAAPLQTVAPAGPSDGQRRKPEPASMNMR